jgi:hypothetical protein
MNLLLLHDEPAGMMNPLDTRAMMMMQVLWLLL